MTAGRMARRAMVVTAMVVFVGLGGVLGCRSEHGGVGPATVPAIHCDAAGCGVCTPCKACMAKMLGTGKK